MTSVSVRRGVARAVAPLLIAVPLLIAEGALAPVHATATSPGFEQLELRHFNQELPGGLCSVGPENGSIPATVQLDENGALSSRVESTRTMTYSLNAEDTLQVRAEQSNRTAVSFTKDGGRTLQLDFSGSTGLTASKAPKSACAGRPEVGASIWYRFTVGEPTLARLSFSQTGNAYSLLTLSEVGETELPSEILSSSWFDGSRSSTLLLHPGSYRGVISGTTNAPRGSATAATVSTGTLKASFIPAKTTSIAVSLSPGSPRYNEALTANITVKGSGAWETPPPGRVTFSIDGRDYTGPLVGGKARIRLSRAVGAGGRTATVSYRSADAARFADSTSTVRFTVAKAKPKASLRLSKTRVRAGARATATVSVSVPGSLGAKASGKVSIYDGKKRIGTATVKNGRAKIKLPVLKRGTHRITAKLRATSDLTATSSRSVKLRVR